MAIITPPSSRPSSAAPVVKLSSSPKKTTGPFTVMANLLDSETEAAVAGIALLESF